MENILKDKKKYKCTAVGCEAKFSRPSKLEVHLRKHTGDRPFACNDCNKTYTNESHLRRHKKTVHLKIIPKRIRCPHEGCYRELANKLCYKKHLNTCHNILRKYEYSCDICKKGFRKKNQLHEHMFQHTGVPTFTCELCHMGFVSRTLFNKHKRNHKTYECKCKILFNRWSDLLKHKKNCDKCKKSFQCETCNKVFMSKSKLKSHKKIHEDIEEKYSCSIDNCNRVYKYEKNLQYHIKRYHLKIERKKIQCTYPGCKKILFKTQNLNNHMKLHTAKKKKNIPRKVRKDKGIVKKSTALRLAGLVVPYEAEKMLINGENVELDFDEIISDSSTESDSTEENSLNENFNSDSNFNLKENSKEISQENVKNHDENTLLGDKTIILQENNMKSLLDIERIPIIILDSLHLKDDRWNIDVKEKNPVNVKNILDDSQNIEYALDPLMKKKVSVK